tara:strand:- start:15025 stop:16014 length:990 start_codon:yes stop_codon:yes gene_type:complete
MTQKEQEFQDIYNNNGFKFSYSSLNRLNFSPKLFYKDYVLKDKEIRTDKHLIEGKLLHLLLLQPQQFDKHFILMPSKLPSDTLRKVLKNITLYTDSTELSMVEDKIILDSLKEVGLYQSLKDEDKRVAKVRTTECEDYYAFSHNKGLDVIDASMFQKCKDNVEIVKANKSIIELLNPVVTDFELDDVETYSEKYLECEMDKFKFGMKGYVDKYIVDHKQKVITIIDLKTSGKSLVSFPETVEFYNYWLQAAIYSLLVMRNVDEKAKNYKINFNFIVIDTYSQVYNFEVRQDTLEMWVENMWTKLGAARFHLEAMKFDLPYDFLINKVML